MEFSSYWQSATICSYFSVAALQNTERISHFSLRIPQTFSETERASVENSVVCIWCKRIPFHKALCPDLMISDVMYVMFVFPDNLYALNISISSGNRKIRVFHIHLNKHAFACLLLGYYKDFQEKSVSGKNFFFHFSFFPSIILCIIFQY